MEKTTMNEDAHRIHIWYIYLHLAQIYGKYRQIYIHGSYGMCFLLKMVIFQQQHLRQSHKNNGIFLQQNRSIRSLTWNWTTNHKWHILILIVHALNTYKSSLPWDESTPDPIYRASVRQFTFLYMSSGHTKVLQMRRWRYSRRSWTATSALNVGLREWYPPWKWTNVPPENEPFFFQEMNHLSQPSIFRWVNLLLFGVADGAAP